MKRVILLSVSILLICLAYSFAAVPCKINYQGRLIKDNVPVDGTKTMVFSIYPVATGGSPIWTSGNVNITVYNGLFRYVLDLSTINWAAGQTLYLEVQVGADTLTPREELSAYPYAINSHLLEGATKEYFLNTSTDTQKKDGGLNIMGNVGIGMTSPGFKLQTYDATNSAIAATDSTTPVTTKMQSTDSAGWVGTHTNHPLYFFINNSATPMMAINTAGNVGIGTTSPQAKLHISGTSGTDGVMFPDGSLQTTATAGFGSWTDKDSTNNTLVINAIYKATSDGFICTQSWGDTTVLALRGFTDSSNPPTTIRIASGVNYPGTQCITMPVKKNDYWKITTNGTVNIIYWLPLGSGQCVRQ